MQIKKPKKVDIQYGMDNTEVYGENMALANEDYDRLVAEGYPSVQIVVSHHPYSEGIWVEAGDKPRKKSHLDHVVKSNL
jgi:hypothetical protein